MEGYMNGMTRGVAGITLAKGDYVVGAGALRPNSTLLSIGERGFGKRTAIEDYRLIKRGGRGVINMNITEKTGEVVAVSDVADSDEMIVITDKGQTIRFRVSDIRVIGRATQGVKLFNLRDGDRITAISRVEPEDEDLGEEETDLLTPENEGA